MLDADHCYAALRTRDARFDGRWFVGVTSTGVFCRPVCPATTPRAEHCRFFPSAAAAQHAGFRPCLRCRPETAPEGGAWRGTAATVSRALDLIDGGALDRGSVGALAARLGLGDRQLRRLFERHLGASPVAVAKSRRVLFAKQLLHETALPMTEVAHASGFGSVRRFNEVFRELYGRPPSELRRHQRTPGADVEVRLAYRGAYDWDGMIAFFAARAMDGVEQVDGAWRRTLRTPAGFGTVTVTPGDGFLRASFQVDDLGQLPDLVARVRRTFDLRADPDAIGAHLSHDPLLAPLVAARPGLRCPGAWDPFEQAVRAILGQQISVEAARRLAVRLVRLCGDETPVGWLFPTPEALAEADLADLPMPGLRKRALTELARATLDTPDLFEPLPTLDETVARLRALRGFGEWTAQYVAMRAVRDPDAFPASDLGLLRAAAVDGVRPKPAELLARAEAWRPFRAHAAQYLWSST